MSWKSRPREFLISSTPFHSPEEDSGYFGSSQKNFYGSNARVLNTYSPIKELCLKNLAESFSSNNASEGASPESKFDCKILDYESFSEDFSKSSSVEINDLSELEFTSDSGIREKYKSSEQIFFNSLSFTNNEENENSAISSFSEDEGIKYKLFEDIPSDSKLENFKSFKDLNNELSLKTPHLVFTSQSQKEYKQTKLDFIHQLKEMNCFSLISYILSCLSDKELCIASCVSKKWNQIILSDYKANCRRKNFIQERDLFLNGPSKENRFGTKYGPARELKKAFSNLTNINLDEHLVTSKDSNTRFDSFLKESKSGHVKLLKCPKCCFASKCLNGNTYLCTRCSHTFCSICLNSAFKNHVLCSTKTTKLPNTTVGSKKSKRNLRRL